MKKNKNRIKEMTTALILSMMLTQGMPILTVKARDSTNVSYSCGDEATTCPESISGSVNSSSLGNLEGYYGSMTIASYVQEVTAWTGEAITEMPTATRPGYTFKGWKSSLSDHIINWDTSLMRDHAAFGSNVDLDLIAVWGPANTGNTNTIPLTVTVSATPINVTLPTSIDVAFDGKSVEGLIADSLSITNNSKTGNLQVKEVSAECIDSAWSFTIESDSTYFQKLPLDSNQIYLGFSSDSSSFIPVSETGFDPGIKLSPVGISGSSNSVPFTLSVKSGGRSESIDKNILNLILTIGYEAASPETLGLEIKNGTITGYTGTSDTLVVPANVTAIDSKALASHPELKTVINDTGRSFDWYDALGETETNERPSGAFSEGSTNNVLIASQTTLDNYDEPFKSQLMDGTIKLTPDSTLTVNDQGLITDYAWKDNTTKTDVVLPAMKNGKLIKGIEDGMKDGSKIDGVSAAAFTKATVYESPFVSMSLGGSSYDKQNGGIYSITLSNSIEKLGALSLSALDGIILKNIPSSLKSVGMGCFMNTNFDKNIADFSHTQLQVIDAYAFSLDLLAGRTSIAAFSNITEIRLPSTIKTIEPNAIRKNFMPGLVTIINPSGKSFDWSTITGSTTSGQAFATGTIIHQNGNIVVRSK